MIEKTCLQFKTRGERKATQGDMRIKPNRTTLKGMKDKSGGKKVDQI